MIATTRDAGFPCTCPQAQAGGAVTVGRWFSIMIKKKNFTSFGQPNKADAIIFESVRGSCMCVDVSVSEKALNTP